MAAMRRGCGLRLAQGFHETVHGWPTETASWNCTLVWTSANNGLKLGEFDERNKANISVTRSTTGREI